MLLLLDWDKEAERAQETALLHQQGEEGDIEEERGGDTFPDSSARSVVRLVPPTATEWIGKRPAASSMIMFGWNSTLRVDPWGHRIQGPVLKVDQIHPNFSIWAVAPPQHTSNLARDAVGQHCCLFAAGCQGFWWQSGACCWSSQLNTCTRSGSKVMR